MHSAGRWGRMSGAVGEMENAAGQKNPSGRKVSDGGEVWGCAGVVEER